MGQERAPQSLKTKQSCIKWRELEEEGRLGFWKGAICRRHKGQTGKAHLEPIWSPPGGQPSVGSHLRPEPSWDAHRGHAGQQWGRQECSGWWKMDSTVLLVASCLHPQPPPHHP